MAVAKGYKRNFESFVVGFWHWQFQSVQARGVFLPALFNAFVARCTIVHINLRVACAQCYACHVVVASLSATFRHPKVGFNRTSGVRFAIDSDLRLCFFGKAAGIGHGDVVSSRRHFLQVDFGFAGAECAGGNHLCAVGE